MKTRILTLMVLLNVALVGFGFYFLSRVSSELESNSRSPSAPSIRERLKLSRAKASAEKPASNAEPTVVYVTNRFHWSQVESADYREYIANLRGVGCPESTIKDIILTDVMRLYAARRGQFYQNGREFKFWETDEKRKLNAKQLEEREKQLALIDKEIPSVLRELLGVNYEREINKYFVDSNEDDRRLNFVSAEKRSQLLALREEIEGLREAILGRATDGKLSEEDREALLKIDEQRRTALAKILNPAELEEFELRTSETGNRLRSELIGFYPTEDEFRLLFELQRGVDEKFAYADKRTQEERQAAQAQFEGQLRVNLGEARYADYQRAKNPDYRNACLFSELYELPSSTAMTIFEIKEIAEREKQNLLSRTNIPEENRLTALQAIQNETERSLRQILGTKLFSNYSQSSGRWVQELGAAN